MKRQGFFTNKPKFVHNMPVSDPGKEDEEDEWGVSAAGPKVNEFKEEEEFTLEVDVFYEDLEAFEEFDFYDDDLIFAEVDSEVLKIDRECSETFIRLS